MGSLCEGDPHTRLGFIDLAMDRMTPVISVEGRVHRMVQGVDAVADIRGSESVSIVPSDLRDDRRVQTTVFCDRDVIQDVAAPGVSVAVEEVIVDQGVYAIIYWRLGM